MKKFLVTGLLVLTALNGIAQTKNQIKFTAKIANRNSDTLVIKGPNNFKQVIPINKKEIFVASFTAPKGFYRFSDGVESSNLYLKPGSEVNLTMNAKEFDETIIYKGKGTNESNFLAQQALKDEKFAEEAFAKEAAEFTALLEGKKKTDLENIEKGDFDAEFKVGAKKSVEKFYAFAAQQYESDAAVKKLKGTVSADFDYENHKGGKTKLSDLKGKYVYIDLWATWCGPCRAEIPFLKKIEEKYHGKNIEFVSVSVDAVKDHDKWQKFVSDKQLGGVQLFSDNEWKSAFVTSYNVTGIPRFILIDPQGNILDPDAERPSSPELLTQLDALLN